MTDRLKLKIEERPDGSVCVYIGNAYLSIPRDYIDIFQEEGGRFEINKISDEQVNYDDF